MPIPLHFAVEFLNIIFVIFFQAYFLRFFILGRIVFPDRSLASLSSVDLFRDPFGRPRRRFGGCCPAASSLAASASLSKVFLFFEPLGRPFPLLGGAVCSAFVDIESAAFVSSCAEDMTFIPCFAASASSFSSSPFFRRSSSCSGVREDLLAKATRRVHWFPSPSLYLGTGCRSGPFSITYSGTPIRYAL